MNRNHPSLFLPRVLKLQAAMDIVFSIATLAGAGWLATTLQQPQALLMSNGGLGLLFGAFIYYTATRSHLRPGAVWSIIGINALSAIANLVALLDGWSAMNGPGMAFTIANIIYSTVFAEMQFLALRRMRTTAAATA